MQPGRQGWEKYFFQLSYLCNNPPTGPVAVGEFFRLLRARPRAAPRGFQSHQVQSVNEVSEALELDLGFPNLAR